MAIFLLEPLLVLRVLEQVLAVVGHEHVAIDDEAVDLAVVAHPVLERRIDVVEFALHSILFDVGIERFGGAVSNHVGKPCGRNQQHIVAASSRLLFENGLGIDLLEWKLDNLYLDAGEFFPFGPDILRVEQRLQPRLRDDRDASNH